MDPSDAVDLVGVPIEAERSSHPERPFLVSFKHSDGIAGSVQNSLAPAISNQVCTLKLISTSCLLFTIHISVFEPKFSVHT